jgi:hypothetical protein
MFGPISLFQNKNTGKLEVVLKTLSFGEESEMQRVAEGLRQRVLSPIPNLISVYHLEEVRVANAFCGSGVLLRIYFEYLDRSLKEEMRKRRKHKNYYFSE